MSGSASNFPVGYGSPPPPSWAPAPPPKARPVVQRWWFWAAVLTIVVVLSVGVYLIIGRGSAPDGTQNYASLAELQAAMNEHGAACEPLTEDENPTFALAQGRCDRPDGELVLQLWIDGEHRDFGTGEVIDRLIGSDHGFCWVLGRGEGAWSINSGSDPALCRLLGEELGGQVREQTPA